MGVVTLIYDHHVGRVAERLTELQHLHLSRVVTTTHVHLDARRCLEVILLRGRPRSSASWPTASSAPGVSRPAGSSSPPPCRSSRATTIHTATTTITGTRMTRRLGSLGGLGRSRSRVDRQGVLPFRARSERLDRAFRLAIAGGTALAVIGAFALTPRGRSFVAALPSHARATLDRLVGMPPDRATIEADHLRSRLLGVVATRAALRDLERDPGMLAFFREAGMGADSAVVRWGNYDWTLALSSKVFAADDLRSYRLLPSTRSIWLVGLTVYRVQAMFEIPDTPASRRLGESVGGRVVPESAQSTNSWGCRGPEADPSAPIRGIVLGDSTMQGLLIGDGESPPARLEAHLAADRKQAASILNTGTLGYSIEQYFQTLIAYHDRLRPEFVVVSICDNDFGDPTVPDHWAESEYWLDRIAQYCRTRQVAFLVVPVPSEDRMLGVRNDVLFPARVSQIAKVTGIGYLDPIEEFAAEHYRLRAEARRDGRPFPYSPLFNRRHGDNHMSAPGADHWGRIVARRVGTILDDRRFQQAGSSRPPRR